MKISLPIQALRSASPEDRKMLKGKFNNSWQFEDMLSKKEEYSANHRVSFNLKDFSVAELPRLWSLANQHDAASRTMNDIRRWTEAIKNPMNADVPSLTALEKMIASMMRDNKYKWLMRVSPDGYTLPYLVTEYKYTPRSKYTDEHVTISLKNGLFYTSDEWGGEEKHQAENISVTFFANHIFENVKAVLVKGAIDMKSFYDLDELDESSHAEDLDDDDDTPVAPAPKAKAKAKKKAAPKVKRVPLKLLQVLAERNLFLPTDETMDAFFAHSAIAYELITQMGKQFTCTTKAYVKERYSEQLVHMHEEGRPYKLVIDMAGLPDGMERQSKTEYAGMQLLPYHPYLRMYNLTKYSYASVHAASLVPYQYNKDILDNMVIKPKLKAYLDSMMGGHNTFVDIIEGKSGGMIILTSGSPGIGKTLTAECYAERMELPLYQIQSSQLGVDVDTIEKNISAALRKAERWGAVLLIDECDTYVRKRGDDIEQNCIVGVWLRLLEYYNGIMFMTTNQHDVIDSAILSRCSGHIKYEMPDEAERKAILKIHCRLQGIDVSDGEASKIAKIEASGRDIRNMLKNINKMFGDDGAKRVKLTRAMVEQIEEYIPFIK